MSITQLTKKKNNFKKQ